MGSHHVNAIVAATLVAALLPASAQVTRPQPQPPLPKPAAPMLQRTGESVTLTGCVKAAAAPSPVEATARPTPPGGMALATNSYLLTNVEDKEHPGNKDGATYALVAATGVNIGEHLGHRVQVTGLVTKPDTDAAKPSERTGENAIVHPPASTWPIVTVTSLMMVSSSCSSTLM